jgi:predicted amidophosphoribosyltransferase
MDFSSALHRLPRRGALALHQSAPGAMCDLTSAAASNLLCPDCERDLFALAIARCRIGALRLPPATAAPICASCARHPPLFDATAALADCAPPVAGMGAALKTGGRSAPARVFGALRARRVRNRDRAHALAAPVPATVERQAERGFNPALEMARRLAHDLALQLVPGARLRIRDAPPQHLLAPDARRHNIRGAFSVRAEVRARHVLGVDAVMTSGSTLAGIVSVPQRAGAARVTTLVVARAP